MEKVTKVVDAIFMIVALLCLGEFMFLRGMFTWLLSFFAIILFGIIEIIFCLINKSYYKAVLVLMLVLAICTGYGILAF